MTECRFCQAAVDGSRCGNCGAPAALREATEIRTYNGRGELMQVHTAAEVNAWRATLGWLASDPPAAPDPGVTSRL